MFSPINKSINYYTFKISLIGALILGIQTAKAQLLNPAAQDSVTNTSNPVAGHENVSVLPKPVNVKPDKAKKNWYEKIGLRGYVQVRYNRLLETNPSLKSEHDKSIGDKTGFLIRRARLVFSGNVHERVFIYIQPDLASTPSGSSTIHFAQLRDAYFDLSLDKKKEFRLRVGQSKVPYGFENMQSSQNRLTLDRNDALNSAVPNERDLGVFFYWAPDKIRKRFSYLVSNGLKGSGDYGVFGLGIYNGQTANKPEANNNQHVVARFSYPLALKSGQIIEPGIQAYNGSYTVTPDQLSSNKIFGGTFNDRRVAGSLVVYPQPFGFQTEYNIGKGPQYDPETLSIQLKTLKGGYAQAMYLLKVKDQILIPFVKAQYYEGGKKTELDARYSKTYETEIGVEWQPIPAFELATQYTITNRTTKDGRALNNHQFGNLLRLQAQFNF
ncbi:porin [Adhaeribacter rhizoryzae]|uniref:Porin n=1 Tax=Adhaeribacter rhizoryzae TaxID=2607907 RepID=A0A5M6D303_9BACT|nr:porin [Adhaeribacter rhizoryzae]KAA5539545.1 porin [Adhaeribacter rhizoryzae]